ncbi:MAG: MFS transporter [Vulcanimicrobiaceae bacterium]
MRATSIPPRDEGRIPERAPRLFSAFAYRDFRLLWTGLLISNVGWWMQFTSLTYLVGVVLAKGPAQSALNLGLLGAVRSVPVLLLSPLAGLVADRYPRRRTLLFTNIAQVALALALAVVSAYRGGWVLLVVYAIASMQAASQCFDSPSRQSWIPLLVPRRLISNAIGLNSIAFNAPMMVGPAIAGVLIAGVSLGISFYANAISSFAVVAALIMMSPAPASSSSREPALRQIAEGLRFIAKHPVLRWIVFMLVVTSFLVRPFTSLLAAYAAHVVFVDAKGYAWLLTAGGLGTITGALVTALYHSERRGGLWFGAGVLASVGLLALGYTHDFKFALLEQVALGLGTMAFVSSSNVLVQTLSPDEMRGRAMSVYSMVILGLVPAGTLLLGSLGSVLGLGTAFICSGSLALLLGFWVWLSSPAVRSA